MGLEPTPSVACGRAVVQGEMLHAVDPKTKFSSALDGAARGLLRGALAGLALALSDFGALWLWLPIWSDRGALLVRVVATLVPPAAVLGGLIGLVYELAGFEKSTRPFPYANRGALAAALLSPALFVVARLLMSGGKMARLSPHALYVAVAFTLLLAVTFGFVLAISRAVDAARKGSSRLRNALLVAIVAAFFVTTKLDQHVLPNLYTYLHGVLAVVAFAFAFAAVIVAETAVTAIRNVLANRPRLPAIIAACVLSAAFVWQFATLDQNQNVRVALFDPRASIARSSMLALDPWLPKNLGRSARSARPSAHSRTLGSTDGLPETSSAHIVLISIDALRADHLGTYGYDRPTSPEIDALAARGVVFERAYAAAPHSSYSLSSTMTSEYLHETVALGLPTPEATFASVVHEHGYHSAAFFTLGIFHTDGEKLARYRESAFGFRLHDHTDRDARATTDRVLEEADRIVRQNEPPSLLWVHYFDVHAPYENTSFGTSDVDRYDSEIRETDKELGRLVRELEARFAKPIVFAITSDHGEEFRDHGGVYHGSTLYEEQIRVPLIVAAPGFAGIRVPAVVQSIDIVPTLLGLTGLDAAPSMRGRDLRPLVAGRVSSAGPAFASVLQKRMAIAWPNKLVADLRFGTYELFDLSRDPHERRNLANSNAELLVTLREHVYGWLDEVALPPGTDQPVDVRQRALDRGRLGDRRAVSDLLALLADDAAPIEMRRDAGRMLGRLADESAAPRLVELLSSPERLVAAEAAIALGRMYDVRAKEALRSVVSSEDPDLRMRGAVSLGRLRDRDAIPALEEALTSATTEYEREEAVRWLGRLRATTAVEALLAAIPEFRTRHLVAVSLGEIGDERAYEPLAGMLDWERLANIRDAVVRGLGLLGDSRAIERIATLAVTEPELENATESLVRLGALERGRIGGVDFDRVRGERAGLRRCVEGALVHDWDYAHRTWCEARPGTVHVRLHVPAAIARDAPLTLILGIKRADEATPVELAARANGQALAPQRVSNQWSNLHWPVRAQRGIIDLELDVPAGATLLLDHALVLPSPAAPSER
jgi:arylsulfatase A-like enzyme